MKIWELGVDVDKYKNLALDNKKEINILLNHFNGKSMIESWKPLGVKFIEDDRDLKIGDASNLFSGSPVLNFKAIKSLNEFFDGTVEVLGLRHDKIEYYILNVIKVIDCLDLERSEFERYPDTGEIMWCNKYVFLPKKVEGQHIFKIPQTLRGLILVSDEFRNKVLSGGLEGFKFKEVWDSEKQ